MRKKDERKKNKDERKKDDKLLKSLKSIILDFNALWDKNLRLLREADMPHSDLLLAEELLHQVTDRIWLIRQNLNGGFNSPKLFVLEKEEEDE